jgi:hypothetical protein
MKNKITKKKKIKIIEQDIVSPVHGKIKRVIL